MNALRVKYSLCHAWCMDATPLTFLPSLISTSFREHAGGTDEASFRTAKYTVEFSKISGGTRSKN